MQNKIELIKKSDIKKMFGWKSDTSLYDAIQKYGFPKQIRLTPKTIRWNKADVEAWIKSRSENPQ